MTNKQKHNSCFIGTLFTKQPPSDASIKITKLEPILMNKKSSTVGPKS